MTPEMIESFAIRIALGNNGGGWATHYTDEQKERWRQFVRDLVADVRAEIRSQDKVLSELAAMDEIDYQPPDRSRT